MCVCVCEGFFLLSCGVFLGESVNVSLSAEVPWPEWNRGRKFFYWRKRLCDHEH